MLEVILTIYCGTDAGRITAECQALSLYGKYTVDMWNFGERGISAIAYVAILKCFVQAAHNFFKGKLRWLIAVIMFITENIEWVDEYAEVK